MLTLARIPSTLSCIVVGASFRPINLAPVSPMSVCTCLPRCVSAIFHPHMSGAASQRELTLDPQ